MRGRAPGRWRAVAAARPVGPRRRRPRHRRRRPRRRRPGACEPRVDRLAGIEAALAEVLRLDVADVQKAVAADAEIDERRLDARLEVDDLALVDVADVIVLAGALDVQLFQHAVLNDRDPAFLRLRDVDQHFLLHSVSCFLCSVAALGVGRRRAWSCVRQCLRIDGSASRAAMRS